MAVSAKQSTTLIRRLIRTKLYFTQSLFASGTPTITLRTPIAIDEPVEIHSPNGTVRLLRHTTFSPQEAFELACTDRADHRGTTRPQTGEKLQWPVLQEYVEHHLRPGIRLRYSMVCIWSTNGLCNIKLFWDSTPTLTVVLDLRARFLARRLLRRA